jgi:hypothetical protein
MADDLNVEIDAKKALRLLKLLDNEARKELEKELKGIMKPLTEEAKKEVPAVALSQWQKYGWRRRGSMASKDYILWNPARVKSGFRVAFGRLKRSGTSKYQSVVVVRNANPAASIFELAGRKTPGSKFVKGLHNSGHGAEPRLLYRVWDRQTMNSKHYFERQVARVMNKLEATVQAKLNERL